MNSDPPARAAGWRKAGSTPDRLRLMAIVTVALIVAVGAVAGLLADRLVRETSEVAERTGEVLIATQQVSASFAEADTAAVSVHLAGADGNREQRRLYEQALDRSTASLEDIARRVGDDQRSHDALVDIGSDTTRYAGLIDAARLASVENLPEADVLLGQATTLNRDRISPQVTVIADRARDRFDGQTDSTWFAVALILLIVAVVVVFGANYTLSKRFRRVVNVPLALAGIALLALTVWSARSFATQQQAFDDADAEAYDAILVSEEIQQTAYRHRALGTASVLANQDATVELQELEATLTASNASLLPRAVRQASSEREAAGATEIRVRWDRYVVESDRIEAALRNGDLAEAEAITQGAANAAFNGFNTSVEAALLDNREQFLAQLERAADSLRWLREAMVAVALVAALLTWWGFAQRIGEYR